MAFENTFITLRDDQIGELRREKAAQFAGALDLGQLGGDARLQFLVPAGDLVVAVAQLAQEPRVLHRNDRLISEGADKIDLSVGERLRPLTGEQDDTDRLAFA